MEHLPTAFARAGVVTLVLFATGCVANSSNVLVTVSSASMDDRHTDIVLEVRNPGARDLTLDRLDYDLSHGETSFPLASGSWTGELDLPGGASAPLPLSIAFDAEPIEPESGLLHLAGQLHHTDHTGYLGLRSMDLTSTPFQIDFTARRGAP